jgi:hypothetical protein
MDAVTYVVAGVGPAPDLDLAVPGRIRDAGEQAAGGGQTGVLAEAFDAVRRARGGRDADHAARPGRAHRIAVARHGFFP